MSRGHHSSINSVKYCCQCGKLFSSNSRPTQCISCNKYHHRLCSRAHETSCHGSITQVNNPQAVHPNKRQRSASTTTFTATQSTSSPAQDSSSAITQPYLSSLTTSLINNGINTFTGRSTRISFVPDVTLVSPIPSLQSASATSSASSQQPSTVSSMPSTCVSTVSALITPIPSSDVCSASPATSLQVPGLISTSVCTAGSAMSLSRSPLASSFAPPSSGLAPEKSKTNKTAHKKKNQADMSPEAIQIEYLTTELNYTHSKIVSQDNIIKDRDHKVKILGEKLKIMEEKLNSDLHGKYFGDKTTPGVHACPCINYPSNCAHFSHHVPVAHQHCPLSQPTHATAIPTHFPRSGEVAAPRNNSDQGSHSTCASKEEYDKLRDCIDGLKVDILQMSSRLSSLIPSQFSTNYSAREAPMIVVEAEIHREDSDNISVASVEVVEEPTTSISPNTPVPSNLVNQLN